MLHNLLVQSIKTNILVLTVTYLVFHFIKLKIYTPVLVDVWLLIIQNFIISVYLLTIKDQTEYCSKKKL